MSKLGVAAMSLAAMTLLGCGNGAPALVSLQGAVSIDGVPVEQGQIDFVPQDKGQGTSTTAPIVAGKYQGKVPPGRVRVFFQATRATGRTIDHFGEPIPETENIIPAGYRSGTTIDVAVGDHEKDFKLQSE